MTERPTDRVTYRVACTRLKTCRQVSLLSSLTFQGIFSGVAKLDVFDRESVFVVFFGDDVFLILGRYFHVSVVPEKRTDNNGDAAVILS